MEEKNEAITTYFFEDKITLNSKSVSENRWQKSMGQNH